MSRVGHSRPRTARASCGLCAALVLSFAAGTAYAYRPFEGTDADVAEFREIELEIGPASYLSEGPQQSLHAPELVFNYGVAPRWELVLEGSHAVALGNTEGEARSSLEGPELSVKTLLRSGSLQAPGTGLSIADELSVILPNSEEQAFGADLAGIFSERFSALTLHVNVAAELTREHYLAPFAGAIIEGPAHWVVRPVAEVYAARELRSRVFKRGSTVSGLLGAIYDARDTLSFDLATRVALQDGNERIFELRAGLTWGFEP